MEVTQSQHNWIFEQVRAGRCTMDIEPREFHSFFVARFLEEPACVGDAHGLQGAVEVGGLAVVDFVLTILAMVGLACWLGWWALLAVPGFLLANLFLLRRFNAKACVLPNTALILVAGGAFALFFADLGWAFQMFLLAATAMYFVQRVGRKLSYHLSGLLLECNHNFFNLFFTGFDWQGAAIDLSMPQDPPQWALDLAGEASDDEDDEDDEDEDDDEEDERMDDEMQRLIRLMDDAFAAAGMLDHVRRPLADVVAMPDLGADLDLHGLLDRLDGADAHMLRAQTDLAAIECETADTFSTVRDLVCEYLAANREIAASLRQNLAKAAQQRPPLARKTLRQLNRVSPLVEKHRRESINRIEREMTRQIRLGAGAQH